MANYDYYCIECETTSEVSHSIKESPEIKCKCGARMSRQIAPTAFHLKGKGWYKDGYSN